MDQSDRPDEQGRRSVRKSKVGIGVTAALAILAAAGMVFLVTRPGKSEATIGVLPHRTAPSSDPSPWRTFVAQDGSFSVVGPGRFALATEPAPGAEGLVEEQHLLFHPDTGPRYDLYWYDAVPGSVAGLTPTDRLVQAIRDFTTSFSGKGSDLKAATVDGYPCADFDDHLTKSTFRVRICIAGRRLYQLSVSESSTFISHGSTADRFIDSFRILHG
jgi:hypothetical protein